MTRTPNRSIRPIHATAVLLRIAVVVVFTLLGLRPALSDDSQAQILAAELLIVRDDLARLNNTPNLSPAHIRGLQDRIKGSLGLLPWLLRQADDPEGSNVNHRALIENLDLLIARHPLNLAPYAPEHLTATHRREALAIHNTYCAGCHDDAGQGDEDTALPARDLYIMARSSQPDVFLARLINGVKGDKTLLFTNPLSAPQLGALWHLYTQRPN